MGNAGEENSTELTKEKFDQLIDIIGLDCLIAKPIIIEGDESLTNELNLLRDAIRQFEKNTNYELSIAVKGKQIC